MIQQFQGDYRWLSNFAPVKIIFEGHEYSSVEHAYMSAKSDDISWKEFCAISSNTPGMVKKASKTIKLKSNWENLKLQVMENCVRQKFLQEPYKTKLIETGDKYIQEGNMWGDKFYGICLKTNQGKNHLGKIIMIIRDELKIN